MKILAIETATDACSVALYLDGEYRANHEVAPRQHAEMLLSRIKRLLSDAALSLNALDALAFGRGPGAFTGIRIGTGVIQGLAFGADLPVVPVSSLQAMAQGAWRECGERSVLVAFDARMGEVYWGAYRIDNTDRTPSGMAVPVVDECVCAPEKISLPEGVYGDWFGTGDGWETYGEVLRRELEQRSDGERVFYRLTDMELGRYPHAWDVAALAVEAMGQGGVAIPAEQAQPVYLRNQVVRKQNRR